jgi:hypothetical protein
MFSIIVTMSFFYLKKSFEEEKEILIEEIKNEVEKTF